MKNILKTILIGAFITGFTGQSIAMHNNNNNNNHISNITANLQNWYNERGVTGIGWDLMSRTCSLAKSAYKKTIEKTAPLTTAIVLSGLATNYIVNNYTKHKNFGVFNSFYHITSSIFDNEKQKSLSGIEFIKNGRIPTILAFSACKLFKAAMFVPTIQSLYQTAGKTPLFWLPEENNNQ